MELYHPTKRMINFVTVPWLVSGILQLWISITILFFAGCNNGSKTRYNQTSKRSIITFKVIMAFA
jgi:hypothetical protein